MHTAFFHSYLNGPLVFHTKVSFRVLGQATKTASMKGLEPINIFVHKSCWQLNRRPCDLLRSCMLNRGLCTWAQVGKGWREFLFIIEMVLPDGLWQKKKPCTELVVQRQSKLSWLPSNTKCCIIKSTLKLILQSIKSNSNYITLSVHYFHCIGHFKLYLITINWCSILKL